nr:MAG TPA: hypothetical protein [Bacteriophage sp.]
MIDWDGRCEAKSSILPCVKLLERGELLATRAASFQLPQK